MTPGFQFWLVWILATLTGCGAGLHPIRGGGSSGAGAGASGSIVGLDSSWISLSALQFYAKLDESGAIQGSVAIESAGAGLGNGVLQTSDGGTVKTATGLVGNAFNFDGVDDYVAWTDPGASSALDFTAGESITILAWVYPTSLPVAGGVIIDKGTTVNADASNFGLQVGDGTGLNGDKMAFYFWDGASWATYRTNASLFTVNTWQHVAFTFTFGTVGSAQLYYNGATAVGAWAGGNGGATPVSNNNPLWLGATNDSAGTAFSSPYAGRLDEVSVWRRALSAAEINAIYLRQKP